MAESHAEQAAREVDAERAEADTHSAPLTAADVVAAADGAADAMAARRRKSGSTAEDAAAAALVAGMLAEVSIRDLRNHGGEVVDRVAAGERLTITRSGKPVAELRPLRPSVPTEILIRRRARLPELDPGSFRADVDSAVDSSL